MSKIIFCDEPIIAGYYGRREYENLDGEDSFFDCYHDLAYHVTHGYRMILETENFYISISADGVLKEKKMVSIDAYEKPDECIEPFIISFDDGMLPWVEYESTLFVGERLLEVEKNDKGFALTFDDFVLKVIPHHLHDSDFPSHCNKNHWSYNHVLGSERHLKRICDCGGEGELLLDFVSDYVVGCKKCKKSTWAQMIAQNAIDEWNSGNLNCDLSEITIE